MILDLPPQIIMPYHYQNNVPAIIRTGEDIRIPTVSEILEKSKKPKEAIVPIAIIKNRLPPTITYLGGFSFTNNAATYTTSSLTLGDATEDSLIVVGMSSGETQAVRNFTAATVAGGAATVHVAPGGDWNPTGLASLVVAPNTAGTVSVTANGTLQRAFVGIWRIKGYSSATPVSTQGKNETGANNNPIFVTLDFPAGGIGVYAYCRGRTVAASWSGATVRDNVIIESNRHAFADKQLLTGATGDVETVTQTDTIGRGMSGAVWV